ncbi:glycoside hydrolase/phage tail family protein [Brevundimonas sp. A19_0]|uniref:baseplate multidomain protein megatron n=1 Tax=Brevundimonas sp. A19_0 TaxID=2821087 RepID=UPI001AD9A25A|nr:glycoside hydrolase/phage tail family protein [Brevundimonas sp. A19_0]MBO9501104.1 glycoside hydrolase/phage tail family protein [Brevundimonas sp. A19_0]
MAQAVLGGLGQALGGGVGQAIGRALGSMLDQRLVASLGPVRQKGPRLDALLLQSTAEGAPMALALGRARVTGQVIWAARFLEQRHEESAGKGGPRVESYSYSLSFAVGVCEGPIDGIGRIWADGQPLDRTGATLRIHRGTDDQMPDPLIEAVEGVGAAPACRGTAYVVFEDLPLAPFGNRVPHLSFEVFRRPQGGAPTLADRLEGVCLIPGAGEFILATEPVLRRTGLTRTEAENISTVEGRPDLIVSLDQLQAACPNLKRVSLVVGWFGTDLRAGHCVIRPGVERTGKPTEPLVWSVAGLDRASAHLVSEVNGTPAYGGTPSDESVRQAVGELKARGLEVTLYPFVFMDIPPENGLADPYGGAEQAAHPWRGRVTVESAGTAGAEVAQMFGTADGWGLRRMALHYAALVAETGADGLLIGSEMRGLTTARGTGGSYPAVEALCDLLAECRAVVGPSVKLSYAADWSEYSGHRPDDGSGDVVFHLDPLWAHPALDYVGIDWYPPLGDWRARDCGLDAETYAGPDDPAYLAMQVAGGEHFDWFYADDTDRAAQVRTPIADLAHGEDWVFRAKDLAGWWSHAHYDRPGGVRSATPTAWEPGMKPIRLTEFGCAAVDRGGNAPNLFQDPKSAENALPPGSTGARDDRMQRRVLEAVLGHFAGEGNPVSTVYGGPMVEAADAWCWDARPWPAFPGRRDLWADAGAWRAGHWLNGRLLGDTEGLLGDLLWRAGLVDGVEIGPVADRIDGYVIDRPMSVREALTPLVAGLGLGITEVDGRVKLRAEGDGSVVHLAPSNLALPEEGGADLRDRTVDETPDRVRVRYLSATRDYQTGSVTLSRDTGGDAVAGLDVDLPAVCDEGQARRCAARVAAGLEVPERRTLKLGPLQALMLEPGDRVQIGDEMPLWRVERLTLDEEARAVLTPVVTPEFEDVEDVWTAPDAGGPAGAPWFRVLELPPLFGRGDAGGRVAAVAVEPWSPHTVTAGPDALSQTQRAVVRAPAGVGTLTEPFAPGPCGRWDEGHALTLKVEGRTPESRDALAVLGGANALAVETDSGWEMIQYRHAEMLGEDVWRLSGLLRGQGGGDPEAALGAGTGAAVVFLDDGLAAVGAGQDEWGLPLLWRAGAGGATPSGPFVSQLTHVQAGRAERPWAPVHLKAEVQGGDLRLSWIPRVRTGGDSWDGEPAAVDPTRFRIRILDGETERRVVEVTSAGWIYEAGDRAVDFPEGCSEGRFAVAQARGRGGWGPEAHAPLCEGGSMP